MAIRVSHQGNAAVDAVAAFEGGRGRRRDRERSQALHMVNAELQQSRSAAQRTHAMQVANAERTEMLEAGHTPPSRRRGRIPRIGVENSQVNRSGGNSLYDGSQIPSTRIEESQINPGNLPSTPSFFDSLSPEARAYAVKKRIDSLYDAEMRKRDVDGRDADFEYRFSAQQKAEIEQMNQAYELARRSGEFTDEELKEIKRQMMLRRAGIEKMPTPKAEPQDPWEAAQSRLFTDPETGRRGYLDQYGVPQFYKEEAPRQDPLEAAQSRQFTDPETGRRGYLDRDGVPQFYKEDPPEQGEAFDKEKFYKRYESIKAELTTPIMEKDASGNMVQTGSKAPEADEILKIMQEQDAAMERYRRGMDSATPPPAAGKPAPEASRRRAELDKLGQDPDLPGGYSDRRLSNGKYIPNRYEPFFNDKGIDQDAIANFAKEESARRGGALSEAEIIAAINMDLEDLAKEPGA